MSVNASINYKSLDFSSIHVLAPRLLSTYTDINNALGTRVWY